MLTELFTCKKSIEGVVKLVPFLKTTPSVGIDNCIMAFNNSSLVSGALLLGLCVAGNFAYENKHYQSHVNLFDSSGGIAEVEKPCGHSRWATFRQMARLVAGSVAPVLSEMLIVFVFM